MVRALRDRRVLRHDGIEAHVVTPRTRRQILGPVLAFRPSDPALDELDGRQTPTICAVASARERISGWLGAWAPCHLLALDADVAAVGISNPVVEAARDDLTDSVNHNNGPRSPYERSLAILTFRTLIDGGEPIVPEEVRAWAVSHGW